MAKKVFLFAVILILLGLGVYAYKQKEAKAPVEEIGSTQETADDKTSGQATSSGSATGEIQDKNPAGIKSGATIETKVGDKVVQGTYSAEEGDVMAPDVQVVQVDYDGTAFSPSTINIKLGDYVIFKNKSTTSFWPASGPHPTHTAYPQFDAKKAIAAGGQYQFRFDKVGSWAYHDHLNESAQGVVNVSP